MNYAFQKIQENDPRLALPVELVPVSEKLMNYALGKSPTTGLISQEEELLFQRYVHLSDNWNAAKNFNNSDLGVVFINRPNDDSLRTVHPNEQILTYRHRRTLDQRLYICQ